MEVQTVTLYRGDEIAVVNESDVANWVADGWSTTKKSTSTKKTE